MLVQLLLYKNVVILKTIINIVNCNYTLICAAVKKYKSTYNYSDIQWYHCRTKTYYLNSKFLL